MNISPIQEQPIMAPLMATVLQVRACQFVSTSLTLFVFAA